ncbi:YciK family oxidoreductase [Beggiatoa leptomitoformis]|uniref:YciK family oxidoreductase n=1 Tax=Beggiatoa leptomitoformis TaxID=288004 RepID=A0A2N9YIC9_9GAMM|nr:YciK family oxidoreductase [Beggiatoa leptomitoformis]ALG67486.1 YciK family oxidoreductase [Beggiatoa leptomitoformis]AUI70292.1 YciK family oxidoreductase [Beggiatoa leptomitoformis]
MMDYKPAPDLLKNRIVLVTGAGDGIGRASARTFAQYGATVILLGRTTRKLEAVYDEIEQAGYPQPAIYPMNLEGASPKDYTDLVATLNNEFGQLDGILHNAGLLGALAPIEHYDINLWYNVIQVNINAPFLLTRACLGLLRKSSDASIIFTSSSVGRKGRAYWGAYAVSKFATEGLMQILADELVENTAIRVNSINPGATRTGMRAAAFPAEDPNTLKTPEEIMLTYLYLMGADSRGITGQALNAQ